MMNCESSWQRSGHFGLGWRLNEAPHSPVRGAGGRAGNAGAHNLRVYRVGNTSDYGLVALLVAKCSYPTASAVLATPKET